MGDPLRGDDALPLTRSIYDRIAPQDETARWAQSVRDYAACHPTWVSTRGGRALHAIMPGDTVPLCGVQPSPAHRAHRWRRGSGRKPEHKLCHRLANEETGRRIGELFERQRREMPWRDSDGAA